MDKTPTHALLCVGVLSIIVEFEVFLTVHHSIDFFQVTNLMHTSFIL